MDNLQWYDFVRFLTALFAAASAWRLTSNIKLRQKLGQQYSPRLLDFLWLIYAYFFLQFAGAIESVTKDTPWKYTTFLGFMITCVALRATRKSTDTLIT